MSNSRTEDEWAMYQLACKYARAVDSNDAVALDDVFTPDAVMQKGSATWSGLDEIKKKLVRTRASSPLFDLERFTLNIEAAYTRMIELGFQT